MRLAIPLILQATGANQGRLLFLISIGAVLLVALFGVAAVMILLRRSYQRRLTEQKLAVMGTTTARILHQIKNPVQTLLLQAELLTEYENRGEAEPRREAGEAIFGEAKRLAILLGELSSWASGSPRGVAPRPLQLNELIGEVVRSERAGLERRGVRLETEFRADPVILADPYFLRQALENLIRNADEALHEQGGGMIRLEVDRVEDGAVLRVADNGPGIPADRQQSIFEPFVTTKGTGMGLGLAICREIVEAHGGELRVHSEPEKGTAFTVRLPLRGGGAASPTLSGEV